MTVGVLSVVTLVAFEAIAVATAMPVVARDLGGIASYTWAFGAFVVASLLGMVVAGTWCDRNGPRRSLELGIVLFAGGAAACGLAPTMAWLVLGRGVQGLGGGATIVALYVLIARAYDDALRPRAFSALAAAWVLPAVVGPLVAGWLADHVSWRAVFLLVPVLVAPPAAVLWPRLRRYDGGDPAAVRPGRTRAGLVAALGLLLVQDGALRAGPLGVAEAVAGVALLVPALRPLLPAGSLRLARGLPTTVVMRGVLAAGFFAAETFVPLGLSEVRGVSTTAAGFTLTAATLGWALGSYLQGRLPGDQDRARTVRLGSLLVALGVATLPVVVLAPVPPWIAGVSWFVGAIGMGLSLPSISVQTLRLSPVADQGVNSAALQLSDSVLVAVAIAGAGAVYAAAVDSGGAGAGTYALVWLLCAGVLLSAAGLAGRMRPIAGTPGDAGGAPVT